VLASGAVTAATYTATCTANHEGHLSLIIRPSALLPWLWLWLLTLPGALLLLLMSFQVLLPLPSLKLLPLFPLTLPLSLALLNSCLHLLQHGLGSGDGMHDVQWAWLTCHPHQK